MADTWTALNRRIVRCERCSRLREHCLEVARTRRAAFRDQTYWGKPVPNFGDPAGRVLLVGLAPAAHGANRTGRMFTGDRSGDFLFEALHKTGFANQPTAVDQGDGLKLTDLAITAAAHCAPPRNKPTAEELANCRPHLLDTLDVMRHVQTIVALGQIGFDTTLRTYRALGVSIPRPKPKFGHGVFHAFEGRPDVVGCYHPSQQNTFTGRLTMSMLTRLFDDVRRQLA